MQQHLLRSTGADALITLMLNMVYALLLPAG